MALVYIHGFNSSPASFKARLTHEALARLGRGAEFVAPALPPRPDEAIAILESVVSAAGAPCCLVGSSLGGYYATYLAERHGLKAVLVNPAVRPYDLLGSVIGPQENYHTHERYELRREDVEALRRYEVARIAHPERLLLLVETGDEVLDYREATARYMGARQVVIEGGDHGFSDFAEYLPRVLGFCGCDAPV
jgi:uncharacterized protein